MMSFGDRAAISAILNLVETENERTGTASGPWDRLEDAAAALEKRRDELKVLAARADRLFSEGPESFEEVHELGSDTVDFFRSLMGEVDSNVQGILDSGSEIFTAASNTATQQYRDATKWP